MKLAIIIPARDEGNMLGETLRAVVSARKALAGIETELIVVNNGSTDETPIIAISARARVVFEPWRRTATGARNAGAEATKCDWLLFLDADTSPTPELFADMLKAIRSGSCDAGSCLIHREGRDNFGIDLWNNLALRRKRLCGAFLFIRSETFHQIGGFDSDKDWGEEQKLAQAIPLARRAILMANPIVLRSRKVALTPA